MLDGLLGRGGFSSKCKSLMKLTKTRIDVIRRKRNATQKFLRKDVADLLSNGLDINAYGRADGLLLEVIFSSCYDFVERCCDVVMTHLSVIQKQRECPEETKVAVASLMLAAASFSDLPELRDLRQLFYERYRDSLALFEDPEFKNNLASAPCTLENKVRLMKEIALEFSIKWDSKAFEESMKSPREPPKAQTKFYLGADKSNSSHGRDKVLNGDRRGFLFKDRFDNPRKEKDGDAAAGVDHRSRHGLSSNGDDNKSIYGLDNNIPRKDVHENPPRVRREYGPDKQAQPALTLKDATPRSVRSGSSSQRKIEPLDIGNKVNGPTIDSRDAPAYIKPEEIPTPLLKSSGKEKFLDGPHDPVSVPVPVPKPKSYRNMAIPPPYIKRYDKVKSRRPEPDFEGGGLQRESDHHLRHHRRDHDHEKDQVYQDEIPQPIPKPRSSRRRHSRSHSFQNEPAADFEELPPAPAPAAAALPRKPRSKRRDDPARRGLQILFDDEHRQKDEEERIIDKLLIHYSKKPSSAAIINDLAVKPRRKPRSRNPHHGVDEGGSDEDLSSHSLRSVSLPREHSGQSAAATPAKVFARAATFQDRSDEARHVHPKLPDYDELAAQFAALRGR